MSWLGKTQHHTAHKILTGGSRGATKPQTIKVCLYKLKRISSIKMYTSFGALKLLVAWNKDHIIVRTQTYMTDA